MNWYIPSPTVMGWTMFEGFVIVKRWVAPRTGAIQGGMKPLAIWEQSWNN